MVSSYRSDECQTLLKDVFEEVLSENNPTLILGDMNICCQKQKREKNIKYLEKNGFK